MRRVRLLCQHVQVVVLQVQERQERRRAAAIPVVEGSRFGGAQPRSE